MTNQMQGEILFVGWEGENDGEWAYTPWMPVRGNFATFGVEVLSIRGVSVTLGWEVQTRTVEDPTTEDEIFSSVQTMTVVGVGQHVNNFACKELVRYRFRVPGTASTTDCVVFRALIPSWRTDR